MKKACCNQTKVKVRFPPPSFMTFTSPLWMYDTGCPPFLSQHCQCSARVKGHPAEGLAQGPMVHIFNSPSKISHGAIRKKWDFRKLARPRENSIMPSPRLIQLHKRNRKTSKLQEAMKYTSFHSVNTVKVTQLQYSLVRYARFSLSLCGF